MITRYYQYQELSPALEDFIDKVNTLRYRYYASELMERLLASPDFDLELEVRKALAICKLAEIPVQKHFRCVYRYGRSGLTRDWKLSELASSIIIVSHDSPDKEIRELQQVFIRRLGL